VAESGHGAALPAELLLKVDLKKVQARQARVASERAERHVCGTNHAVARAVLARL
jgi:hypothetical protein